MITQALQHIHGIGPVRLKQLTDAGVRSWNDAVTQSAVLPPGLQAAVREEADRCLRALAADDIRYFVETFSTQDKWRILTQYLERCSFFDIETTGLEYDDVITLIVCWHKGQLHTFVEHENLDDFLDLLDEVDLLVSFNGSTFDVPRLLDGFHIPELPCPHLDLRWPCYYADLQGGLKQITSRLGLQRPKDLQDADGSLAVELWSRWLHQKDSTARDQLIRYCAADVLLLLPLAQHLANQPLTMASELWKLLPDGVADQTPESAHHERRQQLAAVFGAASPSQLRTRRRR